MLIIDGKNYEDLIQVRRDSVSICGGSVNLPTLEEWLRERIEKAGQTERQSQNDLI